MKNCKYKILLIAVCTFASLNAQPDSTWNILLLKKGHTGSEPSEKKFNSSAFYLFENCLYSFTFKNGREILGRLTDVKKDTLVLTNYMNANVAFLNEDKLDTLAVHYREFSQLKLIADRAMGIFQHITLDRYDFIFQKDTLQMYEENNCVQIYSNDSTRYEIVPYLTAQGWDLLYEENGNIYYYGGTGLQKPAASEVDTVYRKRYVLWLTPCGVEEINGIALGLHPKNTKNQHKDFGRLVNIRDSLKIRGLSLEVNPFQVFALPGTKLSGPYPDSLQLYKDKLRNRWEVKVDGAQLSAVTCINEMRVKGVIVTGLITVVDEIHGLSISGLSNFSYIMNGLSIAVLKNRATVAKGCQIGLINRAEQLRGFQFGLWNKNGKRSLPLLNWQFKA